MPKYDDADLPGGKQFLQMHCYQCDKAVETWWNDTRFNGTILCSTCIHQATRVVCLACGITHTHIKKETSFLYGKGIEIYPPSDFFDVVVERQQKLDEDKSMAEYNENLKVRVEAEIEAEEDKKNDHL